MAKSESTSAAPAPPAAAESGGAAEAPGRLRSALERLAASGRAEALWSAWGLPAIALGICVILGIRQVAGALRLPFGPGPFLWFWLFLAGPRFFCEAWTGRTRGRWIPTNRSLWIGAVLLFVFYALFRVCLNGRFAHDFIMDATSDDAWFTAFLAWSLGGGAIWLRARALRIETSSALWPWIAALPFLQTRPWIVEIDSMFSRHVITLPGFPASEPWGAFLAGHVGLLIHLGAHLGLWWALTALFSHLCAGRKGTERRESAAPEPPPGRAAARPKIEFLLPPVFALSSIFILVFFYRYGNIPGSWRRPVVNLSQPDFSDQVFIGALVFAFLLGGLWLASHEADLARRRNLRISVFVSAAAPVAFVILTMGSESLRAWPLLLAGLALQWTADLRILWREKPIATTNGGGDTIAVSAAPPGETQALRALLRLPLSPLARWGERRPRLPLWAVLLLLWGALLAIFLAGMMITMKRASGAPFDWRILFTSERHRFVFWSVYAMALFFAGVMVPLFRLAPRSIATRFQRFWNARALDEMAITRYSPWEIFWGVAAPGALRPWAIAGITLALEVLFIATVHYQIDPYSSFDFASLARQVRLLSAWILPAAALSTLLIPGFCQRRLLTGLAAYYAAHAISFLVTLALFALAHRMPYIINFTGQQFLAASLWTCLLFAAARWSLSRAPEFLHHITGGLS